MTVGELIVKLIECGNLDAEVYLMSAGSVVEIENDLGIQVYFHGDVPVPEENLVVPEGKSAATSEKP